LRNLGEKTKELTKAGEENMKVVSGKIQVSIDQLFKRIARNENQIVELTSEAE
jgi:ethanolamine utilization protein EutP (predicted NTPase)